MTGRQHRQQRVLVVDDDRPTVMVLAALLAQAGYAVEVARDGHEALAAVDARPTHDPVDAILLDLCMPGMDGFALLEHLAARARPPPVLVMSGDAGGDTAERCRRLGCRGFIEKPCLPQDLLAAVAACASVAEGA